MKKLMWFLSVTMVVSLQAQRISKAAALDDLRFFATAIAESHPANYRSDYPVRVFESIQELARWKKDSLTDFEFRLFVGDALGEVGCIHTSVRAEPQARYPDSLRYFPFQLALLEGERLCIAAPDSSEYRGMEVLAINTTPAREICRMLTRYLAGDGSGEAYPRAVAGRLSSVLVARLFDFPSSYGIKLKGQPVFRHGTPKPVFESPTRFPFDTLIRGERLTFGMLATEGKEVAVLRMRAFRKGDRKEIRSVFKWLGDRPEIDQLVIDLRGNGGGSRRTVSLLTQFLVDEPFGYALVKPKLKSGKYLSGKGKLFLGLSQYKYSIRNFFRSKNTPFGRQTSYRYRPKKAGFAGHIKVLTDGFTASSSTMLTTWLNLYTDAIFVGEQPGGGYNGNNGGSFPELKLPNSGMRIRFPLYRLVLDEVSELRAGLQPTVQLSVTAEDLRRAEDPFLKKVIELVKAENE